MGARKIRFDGWVLDPESGDLERVGVRIRLQEQPLHLFLELIAASGGVVTREQLIARLWPRGIVDFDTGLNTAIRKLRVAPGIPRTHRATSKPCRGAAIGSSRPWIRIPNRFNPRRPERRRLRRRCLRNHCGSRKPLISRAHADAPAVAGAVPVPPRRAVLAVRDIVIVTLLLFVAASLVWWQSRSHGDNVVSVVAPSIPIVATSVTVTRAPDKSIAVLPFIDLSEKKDQEYFSDGLSEELIDLLTKIPDLRVPARTSSFYFKGQHATIAEIAKALSVAHLLEGSVRKAGNTIRVTAQLVRADNGYHLWSETYDRDLKDVFKVQDEIAGAVVSTLKLKLAPRQQATNSHRPSNPEAYNQYLLGRQAYDHANLDGFRRAVESVPESH